MAKGIILDNSAPGSLVIRGPATGSAVLSIPDMTGITSQVLALDAEGNFTFQSAGTQPTELSQLTNDAGFITSAGAPVQSVAGRTGAVVIPSTDVSGLSAVATSGAYADLSGKPTIPTVPTAVSAFTNDSGYQTAANVTTAITSVVGAAPGALDTLAKIDAQLASDESAAAALVTTVTAKADSSWVTTQLANYTLTSALATVATTGAYS